MRDQRIVRYHQHSLIVMRHQFLDNRHDFPGALAIQVTRRFVVQQKRGVRHNGSCNRDALFLSAGKLPREVMHAVGQSNNRERRLDVRATLALGKLGQQQRQFDVLKRIQHWNQVVHLEDEANVPGAPLRQVARGHVRNLVARHGNAPACGNIQPA